MNSNKPSEKGKGGAQTGSNCTHQAERQQQQQRNRTNASDSAQLPRNKPNLVHQQNKASGSVFGAESDSHPNVQPLLTDSFKEFQKNWQQQMKKADLGSKVKPSNSDYTFYLSSKQEADSPKYDGSGFFPGGKKNHGPMSSQPPPSAGHPCFSFIQGEAHAGNVAFAGPSASVARAPSSLGSLGFMQQPSAVAPSAHVTYPHNISGASQRARQLGNGRVVFSFPGHHRSEMVVQAPENALAQGSAGFQLSRLSSNNGPPHQSVSQVTPHTLTASESLPPSRATDSQQFLSHNRPSVAGAPSRAQPLQVNGENGACAYCSKQSDHLMSCSCRDIFYCDDKCQVAHWPLHKEVCAWRAKKRKEKAAKKRSGQQA